MRTVLECLRNADRCEATARASRDETDRKALLEAAAQWKMMAGQAKAQSGGEISGLRKERA